jgi:hypothetical protein
MGSPNLVLNDLILKDRRRIQQTAVVGCWLLVVGKTNVTKSLGSFGEFGGFSLRPLRLKALKFGTAYRQKHHGRDAPLPSF